jgi:Na+-transporting methylmalonyl-CoA/oxaloacetate decarboxylase gamma subunit
VGFLIVILTLALLAVVVGVVSAPLRRARGAEAHRPGVDAPVRPDFAPRARDAQARERLEAPGHDELEAAREAKYREIRDTELDFRTGKLSREDYQAIDADLRAEAIEILDRLEELRPRDA